MTSEFCISSSLKHVNVVKTLDLVIDEHHTWCEGDIFINALIN